MRIHTIWAPSDPGEMPWLVDAIDEYSVEENNGFPDNYKNSLKPGYRELAIDIPDSAVEKLFQTPVTKGTVKE